MSDILATVAVVLGTLLSVLFVRETRHHVAVEARDSGFEMILRDGGDTAAAMQRLITTVPVARVELARPRLEDIFVTLVADDSVEAESLRSAFLQQLDDRQNRGAFEEDLRALGDVELGPLRRPGARAVDPNDGRTRTRSRSRRSHWKPDA